MASPTFSKKDMRVLVVGCGFSGATMARLLAEYANRRILIIDRRDHIAGNSYDYRDVNGITVHRYGSHIFHTSSEDVWNFISRFAEFNAYVHKVVAVVDGKEVPVPFNLDSLFICYPRSKADALEKKLLERYPSGTEISVLDFMRQEDLDLRGLADFIYKKIFLGYTCKQWGTAPEDTAASVLARVPVRINRDCRYFRDRYQGIPLQGYTQAVHRMLDHPNIEISLNTDFAQLRDRVGSFEHVFYTGCIDEYFDYSLGALPYRSVHLEQEELNCRCYQSNAVVNYPCDFDFTRIHEYKYYLGETSPRTVIAREYPGPYVPGMNEPSYPIANDSTARLYASYVELAKEHPNVHFFGRLGDYRYYNMDAAIERALQLFHHLYPKTCLLHL